MKTIIDRMPGLEPFSRVRSVRLISLAALLTHLRALLMLILLSGIFPPLMAAGQVLHSKDPADNLIELIQVSISENNNREVKILFQLDETATGGDVYFTRGRPLEGNGEIILDTLDVVPIEDLLPYKPGKDFGNNLFLYTDVVPDTISPPFQYYLFPDLDAEEGSRPGTNIHGTIFLEEIQQNRCEGTLDLVWSHYLLKETPPSRDTLPPFFTHYRILLNGEETDVVAFDAEADMQSASIEIERAGTQTVRIEAVDAPDPDNRTRFSLSNQEETMVDWAIPQEVVVHSVHINEAGEAEVKIRGDVHHEEFAYRIFRSDNPSEGFEQVGEVKRPSDNPFVFVDEFSAQDEDAGSNLWYYRAEAVLVQDNELCDEARLVSAPESSILLFVEEERQGTDAWVVTLGFDHKPFSASYTYDIARRVGDEGSFEIVDTDQAGSYVADLSDFLPFAGDVFFRVEGRAQVEAVNEQGEADDGELIHSNVVRVTMEPEVTVPNAFRPASKIPENREFRPIFVGFDPENYRLLILDRQGMELFSTDDSTHGWDGTAGGVQLPENTYYYHFRYTDGGGELHERKGVVYLVR
ncbi:MAG: gliding motility-associated C-terminal domain-containing protein [Bacteroidales bacterium]